MSLSVPEFPIFFPDFLLKQKQVGNPLKGTHWGAVIMKTIFFPVNVVSPHVSIERLRASVKLDQAADIIGIDIYFR